jgi:hypothetical protein
MLITIANINKKIDHLSEKYEDLMIKKKELQKNTNEIK